jgi:hypothetical protein
MVGQLAAWIMEVWYSFLIGCLSAYYDMETLREVSTFLKNFEFMLIPLVEIHTSLPIRKFILKSG